MRASDEQGERRRRLDLLDADREHLRSPFSPDDPGLLVFHENWVSKADLAHLASPHIDAFRAVAPDLLAEPPDITLWTEVKD